MGALIGVISPEPITMFIDDDIPMLETRCPVIVMKRPKELFQVAIDKEISSTLQEHLSIENVK